MGNSDSTNDAAKSGAGGSGGVVYLKANDLVINSGVSIRADGGPGAPLATGGNTGATDSGGTGSAAGGGGRVYLEGTNLFLNQGSLSNENLSANKGGEAAHSPFPSGISGLQLWLDASELTIRSQLGSDKSRNGIMPRVEYNTPTVSDQCSKCVLSLMRYDKFRRPRIPTTSNGTISMICEPYLQCLKGIVEITDAILTDDGNVSLLFQWERKCIHSGMVTLILEMAFTS